MEIEHALIVAKAYFPNSLIWTEDNGNTYLMSVDPNKDNVNTIILIVLNEDDGKGGRDGHLNNTCWCPLYNDPEDWFMPVEKLTEKEWIKQLKAELQQSY